jgi:predicted Zn finger-like uncharacterized protein
MSLEVACPSCEGKFRVPDSAAGKKIRCPKCKGAIEVPAADASGEVEEESPDPEPEPESEPESEPEPEAPAPSTSIEVACPSCEGKFRVPGSAAGKKIRCPKCKGAIEVPAGSDESSAESPVAEVPPQEEPAPRTEKKGDGRWAGTPKEEPKPKSVETKAAAKEARSAAKPVEQWFLKGEDGESYGPVPKDELDDWKAEGRVTAECQLLQEGSSQWKWAAEVYSDLAPAEEEAADEATTAKKGKSFAIEPEPEPEQSEDDEEEEFEPSPTPKHKKGSEKKSKKAHHAGDDEGEDKSPRSKAIAGLLGIFLGVVGAHRFYLGYWGLGIAMVLTGGGCGIWGLIDGIFILLGKIPDADGRPLSD